MSAFVSMRRSTRAHTCMHYLPKPPQWDLIWDKVDFFLGEPEHIHSGQVQKFLSLRKRCLRWSRWRALITLSNAFRGCILGQLFPRTEHLKVLFSSATPQLSHTLPEDWDITGWWHASRACTYVDIHKYTFIYIKMRVHRYMYTY